MKDPNTTLAAFKPYAALAYFLPIYLVLVAVASLELSPAVDEPLHVRSGMAQLTRRAYVDASQAPWSLPDKLHPPIDMAFAAAARLAGEDPDFRDSPWIKPQAITAARWVNHLLGATLLVVVMLWGRELWGNGGLLAMMLVGMNPLFLAHASIISSDLTGALGGTAGLWALWHYYLKRREGPEDSGKQLWIAALICGIAIAFAIVCKVSNMLLIPIAFGVCLVGAWGSEARSVLKRLRTGSASALMIGMIALALAAGVYRYANAFGPEKDLLGRNEAFGFFDDLMLCAQYATQLGEKLPSPVFYKGWLQDPSPKHYLAAFIYKTPLPLLALLGAGFAAAVFSGVLERKQRNRERSVAVITLAGVVMFMAVYFTTRGFYLGMRHLLLPITLLSVLAGSLAGIELPKPDQQKLLRTTIQTLTLFCCMTGVFACPWWLSYQNLFARDRLILVDSDFDWGQGLKELAVWQGRNIPGQPVWLGYFGSVRPEDYGVQYRGLLSPFAPGVTRDPEAEKAHTPEGAGGIVALSATQLSGRFMWEEGKTNAYYADWLKETPVAKLAGGTIFIYDKRQNLQ